MDPLSRSLVREGLVKMKRAFHDNPKFGDEQHVSHQILSVDEHVEKLFAEIKRLEVETLLSASDEHDCLDLV